jgi:hypothetical protein
MHFISDVMTEKCSFRAGPYGGRYRHLTGPVGVGLTKNWIRLSLGLFALRLILNKESCVTDMPEVSHAKTIMLTLTSYSWSKLKWHHLLRHSSSQRQSNHVSGCKCYHQAIEHFTSPAIFVILNAINVFQMPMSGAVGKGETATSEVLDSIPGQTCA